MKLEGGVPMETKGGARGEGVISRESVGVVAITDPAALGDLVSSCGVDRAI